MSSEWRRVMEGPSARAVGQAGEAKEPDTVGRISGGGLSFGDFSLATQRKVTRPGPKGRRNPSRPTASRPMRRSRIKRPRPRANVRLHLTANRTQGPLATQRKVTRPGPKGRRNPSRLTASHPIRRSRIKRPRPRANVRLHLTANRTQGPLATQRKVTRPGPKGRRNPSRPTASRPMRRSRIKKSQAKRPGIPMPIAPRHRGSR